MVGEIITIEELEQLVKSSSLFPSSYISWNTTNRIQTQGKKVSLNQVELDYITKNNELGKAGFLNNRKGKF